MPLESASYISSLVASNPASTDTVSQADDHIRLIKQVLKATFPNLNAPVTATPAQLNSAVPTGFIGMWSGSVATIPTGWALCDGSSGRPDLRDRFIVGAGSSYNIGDTGGSSSVTLVEGNLPSHSHSFSGTGSASSTNIDHTHGWSGSTGGAGGHSHSVTIARGTGAGTSDNNLETGSFTDASYTFTTSSVADHTHTVSGTVATGGGSHTHTITVSGTVGSTGSGTAHENRPPYFALAFIIKL